jgi:uncharacterized zinc-type alcohol dehydrogenase-like protein
MIQAKGYAAQSPATDLTPWNFERREVGPHDVQIDIAFCGVCHSDLHQVNNDWFPGIFPMVPGHEIVGRIYQVGDHVKKFKAGDLAGVGCLVDSCQHCANCEADLGQYCLEGNTPTYNALDRSGNPTYGGYSNTIVVREEFVVSVSDKLDLAAVAHLLAPEALESRPRPQAGRAGPRRAGAHGREMGGSLWRGSNGAQHLARQGRGREGAGRA